MQKTNETSFRTLITRPKIQQVNSDQYECIIKRILQMKENRHSFICYHIDQNEIKNPTKLETRKIGLRMHKNMKSKVQLKYESRDFKKPSKWMTQWTQLKVCRCGLTPKPEQEMNWTMNWTSLSVQEVFWILPADDVHMNLEIQ